MPVDRLTVAMDAELGASVRQAATRSGVSVSAWVAAASADRLRNELLGIALDAFEAAGTPFTAEELDAAAEALGLAQGARAAT